MKFTSLHVLLTYKCNLKCDHCFISGEPRKSGLMTLADIKLILEQARQLGSVRSIYFEGGEPFLYYPLLIEAVKEAFTQGFEVGIVTNAFWASTPERALDKLRPFAGLIKDLSISSDLYHWGDPSNGRVHNACQAAEQLGIPFGTITISQPEANDVAHSSGQLPIGESGVMYRGRAVHKLASRAPQHHWQGFNTCPYEDLVNPGRVHLDPSGDVLLCEGILLGNIHQNSLEEICLQYNPESHPVIGPLLAGGPAELVRKYELPHEKSYADACHLCYLARGSLRSRFPEILAPAHIYQDLG